MIDTLEAYGHEYMSYDESDVNLQDINHERKNNIGFYHDVKHLSDAVFPTPAFPVEGITRTLCKRMMVPLVLQQERNPKTLNVWCVVDTTSPFTCLSVKTLEAFMGEGNVNPKQFYGFSIQEPDNNVLCYVSKIGSKFEHVDILGINALRALKVSMIIDWKRDEFRLERS